MTAGRAPYDHLATLYDAVINNAARLRSGSDPITELMDDLAQRCGVPSLDSGDLQRLAVTARVRARWLRSCRS